MKTHEEFEALLDAFVDGELSPEELRAVQDHLNTCPDCRAYVDDALAIRAAFPTVEETQVPEGFADGVMEAIRAQTAPTNKQAQPWKKLLLPLAACIAIVLFQTLHPTAVQSPAGSGARSAADQAEATAEYALEPAMELPAEEAPALEEEAPYFVHATLTSEEAGAALDPFQPVSETEEACHYRLTAEEYTALLDTLAQTGVTPAEAPAADPSGDLALVTVLK